MSSYDIQLKTLKNQAESLQKEIDLLRQLQALEQERGQGRGSNAGNVKAATEKPLTGRRGRPPKAKVQGEAATATATVAGVLKKGRGRPKKVQVEGEAPKATRAGEAPGSANEAAAPNATQTVKKGRGRPKKVQVEGEAPKAPQPVGTVKRGRGRPKKVQGEGEGQVVKEKVQALDKSIDLPSLLETIGQQVGKPLAVADFVTLVRETGYSSKARDFPNMVYQALLRLTHAGTFKRNNETREYTYVASDAA